MTSDIEIKGYCNEKFNTVKDVFRANFEEDLEVGASFAVTIDGKHVIDIWSGYTDADKSTPWEKDTIVNVFSTTKVMTAICIHILVDRGLLDLEAPVSSYWPEFGQAGKKKLPVKYLLSHTSGLAGWDRKFRTKKLYNWDLMIELLALQEPWWEPGTKSGYHTITFGFLLGELIRRSTKKTVGTFFREEVAEPLDADFYIGVPESQFERIADLIPPPPIDLSSFGDIDPKSVAMRSLSNPFLDVLETRTKEWRTAEIPAANGHGNARSVSRITAALACGGELDGIHLLSKQEIKKSIEEQAYGMDLVLNTPIRFGLGWGLQSKDLPIGPNENMFYWGGYGGSVIVVDLDERMSMAYVMNKMVSSLTGDPRSERLIEALYSSL
ncbi:MAG: class A beta-lactamase-related serine hydrolase [Promethearchaeota archaeon]|nr:MAG: class A beta-lactamase-related serine hydrolase [Candidatus Lokiarchaeota archaeon]